MKPCESCRAAPAADRSRFCAPCGEARVDALLDAQRRKIREATDAIDRSPRAELARLRARRKELVAHFGHKWSQHGDGVDVKREIARLEAQQRKRNPSSDLLAGRGYQSLDDWAASPAPRPSVARVLGALAHHEAVLTLPQLVQESGLSVATIRKAVAELAARRLAVVSPQGVVVTHEGQEAAEAFEHLKGVGAADDLDARDYERMEAQALRARGIRTYHPVTMGPTGERARTYFAPHAAASEAHYCASCKRGHTPGEHRGHRVDSRSYKVGLVGQRYENPRPSDEHLSDAELNDARRSPPHDSRRAKETEAQLVGRIMSGREEGYENPNAPPDGWHRWATDAARGMLDGRVNAFAVIPVVEAALRDPDQKVKLSGRDYFALMQLSSVAQKFGPMKQVLDGLHGARAARLVDARGDEVLISRSVRGDHEPGKPFQVTYLSGGTPTSHENAESLAAGVALAWRSRGRYQLRLAERRNPEDKVRAFSTSGQSFRYGAHNRPIGYATVPRGWIAVENGPMRDATHPVFRHGVVVYERPLTADELRSYELVPVLTDRETDALVQAIAASVQDHAAEYVELAEEEPRSWVIGVGQKVDETKTFPSRSLDEIARQVLAILKGKRNPADEWGDQPPDEGPLPNLRETTCWWCKKGIRARQGVRVAQGFMHRACDEARDHRIEGQRQARGGNPRPIPGTVPDEKGRMRCALHAKWDAPCRTCERLTDRMFAKGRLWGAQKSRSARAALVGLPEPVRGIQLVSERDPTFTWTITPDVQGYEWKGERYPWQVTWFSTRTGDMVPLSHRNARTLEEAMEKVTEDAGGPVRRVAMRNPAPARGMMPLMSNPPSYTTLDGESFARFLNDIGAIRPGGAWTKADEGRINMALFKAQELAQAQGKSLFSGANAFGGETRGAAESAMEGDPAWARIVVQGLFSMVVEAAPIFDREGRVAYEKRVNPFLKVAARLKWFFK